MINCKTLIIFTTIVFLSAESRPFGDLLRALLTGHLYHPHTRIVDHHHYYTDDINRRNDYVHYYPHQHHLPHRQHGELLHRVPSEYQPGVVICCRVNPLQPLYKKPPTSLSAHQAEGHVENHGNSEGVNHNHHDAGLHTSVIYHGPGNSGYEFLPHVHHHSVNCDKKHHHKELDQHHESHDDKHHDVHNDKHNESHEDHSYEHQDKHHENHGEEHHDKDHGDDSDEHHDKHHVDHSGEHNEEHDNKHHVSEEHHDHKNYEHHEDHSDEHHDSTSSIDKTKMNEKPSYEVFENVSDVPKKSSSNINVNEISKKPEDNIVF